jgi:methylated-DNA-[protein]-cysteine S-methyltransferase
MELLLDKLASEIGTILIVSDGEKLCALDFSDYEQRMGTLLQKRFGTVALKLTSDPQGFTSRLQAYLHGDLQSLKDVPVSPGGTAFQQKVWQGLCSIPVGKVSTYGELATKLGQPTASRAVGMANSLNPIAIVLPCHRVIGANASLVGYAGGLERKRWLLEHEGFLIAQSGSRNFQESLKM